MQNTKTPSVFFRAAKKAACAVNDFRDTLLYTGAGVGVVAALAAGSPAAAGNFLAVLTLREAARSVAWMKATATHRTTGVYKGTLLSSAGAATAVLGMGVAATVAASYPVFGLLLVGLNAFCLMFQRTCVDGGYRELASTYKNVLFDHPRKMKKLAQAPQGGMIG